VCADDGRSHHCCCYLYWPFNFQLLDLSRRYFKYNEAPEINPQLRSEKLTRAGSVIPPSLSSPTNRNRTLGSHVSHRCVTRIGIGGAGRRSEVWNAAKHPVPMPIFIFLTIHKHELNTYLRNGLLCNFYASLFTSPFTRTNFP
jgi:hypothetical protein